LPLGFNLIPEAAREAKMTDQREATLDDLLSEPIIRTVMASDGVRGADIRRLFWHVRAREEQTSRVPVGELGQLRLLPAGEAGPTIY
jgi:hypothetical protein